ncbi:RsiV family protein [Bacillaceae bacterium W0354]
MGLKTYQVFLGSLIFSMIIGHLFVPKMFIDAEETVIGSDVMFEKDAKDEKTDFEGIHMKKIKKDEPTYSIDIEMPSFTAEKLNLPIKKHVKHVKEQFFAAIKGQVSTERPGNLTIRTYIYLSGTDLYSIVMDEEMYSGGANVNQQSEVWLVDLNEEKFVNQELLFKAPDEAREVIRPLVKENILQSEQYRDYVLEDSLEEWVNKENYHFDNMFVRGENLVFKFDKYEVVAGAAGMPEIEIPISEVKDLLKPKWYERLTQ